MRPSTYPRSFLFGLLEKALDEVTKNWLVVDMKKDWKVIFPAGLERPTKP